MRISVVTATWNSEKTLRDTIESVFRQSYDDVEYIIADGESKDSTMNIVKEYESKFNGRLRWFSGKDRGIYDAMNKGLQMATGDVVGIINSDDFFTTDDVLEKVAETFINNTQLDAVYGDIHFVKPENLAKCTRYFSSRYFRPWALRFGFMPAHPSFYVRKEVFGKFGFYDLQYRTSSDFEMMVRLLHKHKIHTQYINKDFVTMRSGGASTANFQSKRNVQNDIARSLKVHGVYSNRMLQCVRYAWRIGEIIYTKIKY